MTRTLITILLVLTLVACKSPDALVEATQTQFQVFQSTSQAFEKVIRAADMEEEKRQLILEAIGKDRIAFGDINVNILRLLESQVGVSEALAAAMQGLDVYLEFKAKLEEE